MNDLADGFAWARRLRVRHLESLLVLDEAGTLTEAAARLHMTQSAMSHWLAEMEELVGTPLVVRGRQLALTPSGRLLKQLALSVLGEVSRVRQALDAVAQGKAAQLHIGSVWSGVATLLPAAITRFQEEHPAVAVTVIERPVNALLERLARKELDLVVGTIDARVHHAGVRHETLFEDGICVVAGRGSPLWGDTRRHTLAGLAQQRWIVPPQGTSMRAQWDAALLGAGVPWLLPRVETAAITTLLALLDAGDYIGVCSEEMTRWQAAHGMLHRLSLEQDIRCGAVGVAWNQDGFSETVEAFVRTVQAAARFSGVVRNTG